MVKLDRKVKKQGEGLGKNLAHKAKKSHSRCFIYKLIIKSLNQELLVLNQSYGIKL